MSHPSIYYVRFLLVTGRSSGSDTIASVNSTLEDLELPVFTEKDFSRAKATFAIPDKLMLSNYSHEPTAKFMRDSKIYSMWNPSDGDLEIFELLQLVRPRETAQILLMGGMKFADIAERVTVKHNLSKKISERTIELLHHYFWNTTYTSATEWHKYLWTSGPRSDLFLGALQGEEHALFKAGINQDINGKESLRNSYMHVHFRIDATRAMPTCRDTADILSKLIKEQSTLYEAIFGGGEDLKNIVKELQAFKFPDREKLTRSITDIVNAGGSFSGVGGNTNAKVNVNTGSGEVGSSSKREDDGQPEKIKGYGSGSGISQRH